VVRERQTLKEILEHLEEIHRRRVYADLGYSSLFKYLVKELRYSEGAAARRINVLNLVKEVPKAKEMIANGELNLTSASLTQTLLKNEKKKEQFLNTVRDLSSREVERKLIAMTGGGTGKKEVKRRCSADSVRISLILRDETMDKMNRLKAMTKKYDTAELIDFALELALKQCHPGREKGRISKGSKNYRVVPAKTKRKLFQRAQNSCEIVGCGEIHHLEMDHIVPFSLGGSNELPNLRLLCRAHHQRISIKTFGQLKMDTFLNS